MQIKLPWVTLYGEPRSRSRFRCAIAMLAHEFIYEPFGYLIGHSEHSKPNRWTTRYSIGVPTTLPPKSLQASYFLIGSDNDPSDVPVVDSAFLFQTDGESVGNVGSGANGTVIASYRGNSSTNSWEQLFDSNAVRMLSFPFQFDTVGLAEGVELFTPTIGDFLIKVWFEIDEIWDGETPKVDFGMFIDSDMGIIQNVSSNSYGLDNAPNTESDGISVLAQTEFLSGNAIKFILDDPIKLIVTTTGDITGDDPESEQGSAILHLLIATPES